MSFFFQFLYKRVGSRTNIYKNYYKKFIVRDTNINQIIKRNLLLETEIQGLENINQLVIENE